jgi:hypothetical protein
VALNKEWHRSNRMPPKATRESRIKWHAEHAIACGCRAVPESIKSDVEKLLAPCRKGTQSGAV